LKPIKRIRRLAKKWISPLGLGYWNITIVKYAELEPARNAGAIKAFTGTALPEYLDAIIEYDPKVIKMLDDEELEQLFVHELMHLFTAELLHECDDLDWHIENVCTRLAKAFIWAVDLVEG
jgi:hypothetical protein